MGTVQKVLGYPPTTGQLIIGLAGFALAWFIQDWRNDLTAEQALITNYANRATICTEALARLRIGDTHRAIDYLDDQAIKALHGVPNWKSFEALPVAGQRALSQAKTYRSMYPTKDEAVNWYLRDVPPLTDNQTSISLKALAVLHDDGN